MKRNCPTVSCRAGDEAKQRQSQSGSVAKSVAKIAERKTGGIKKPIIVLLTDDRLCLSKSNRGIITAPS